MADLITLVVVCDSRHHSLAVLRLAEQIAAQDSRVRILGIAETRDAEYFRSAANGAVTIIVSPAVATQMVGAPQPAGRKGLVGRLHGLARKLESGGALGKMVGKLARETSLGAYARQRHITSTYRAYLRFAHEKLAAAGAVAVLAFGDRTIDLPAAVLAAARSRKIPIILPYVTYSHSGGLVVMRRIEGGFKWWQWPSLYRLWCAARFPKQLREGYFFQKPSMMMALHACGMLAEMPWEIGGGHSDIVCVDSAHNRSRYERGGVPAAKLRVVGDVAYDALFAAYQNRDGLRAAMIASGNLNAAKPILVLALPQLAEQGVVGWERHWKEINGLMTRLAGTGCNLVVSLHPRVNRADYLFLEERYGVHLAPQALAQILPIADVFVAANSSTLTWATLCGVPSVVLDYFGLDSSGFRYLASLRFVDNREAILAAVEAALAAPRDGFAQDWQSLSRDAAFDGHVLARYRALILAGAA